jgi:hypothetical protein
MLQVSGSSLQSKGNTLTRDALEFTLAGEKTTNELLPYFTLFAEKLFCGSKNDRNLRFPKTKR